MEAPPPRPSAAAPAPRRKFATPPVKAACTACRAARTRCDGKEKCTSCVSKGRECVYVPSKRGGPRVYRKRLSQPAKPAQQSIWDPSKDASSWPSVSPPSMPPPVFNVQSMVGPGAGLNQLDSTEDLFQDSDMIFDSIFWPQNPEPVPQLDFADPAAATQRMPPFVRCYIGDQDLLDAYYIFIHQYFPILPPPCASASLIDSSVPRSQAELDEKDVKFIPSSPLSLAIAAILTLIPHEDDPDPDSEEAVIFRRRYSHFLAQSAMESIEVESELPDSATAPARALSESQIRYSRPQFHPAVPVELETPMALALLSVYEYSQRGNLGRMRNRAGQSLVAAMDLSLHSRGDQDEDQYSEARSRAWWMAYVAVLQGAIVSSVPPTVAVYDPSFTTRYPMLEADSDAWPFFIKSQQTILAATQFVSDLNKAIDSGAGTAHLGDRMQELEAIIEPLCAQADAYVHGTSSIGPVDCREGVVGDSLKVIARIKLNSARIKIHRYSAFFDHPIFNHKHCDLKSTGDNPSENGRLSSSPTNSCGCSASFSMFASQPQSNGLSCSTAALLNPSGASPSSSTSSKDTQELTSSLPFSNHTSGRICLKAALNIAHSFEVLPYPFLAAKRSVPRTMPSMSCCAMQASYALLMIRQKTQMVIAEKGPNDVIVQALLAKVQRGLQSISSTLDNYAICSEAIAGMRATHDRSLTHLIDQIQEALNM